jgi:outer membrane protein
MATGIKLMVSLLSALLFIQVSEAQQAWTLTQCIAHAREHNLSIRQADLNATLAEVARQNALESRLPSLSFSTNYGFRFGRTIDPTTNAFENAALSTNGFSINTGVLLYNGNNLQNTIRRARIDVNAAQQEVRQTQNQVALELATLYLNIVLAKENAQVAQNNVEFSKRQLAQVQSLVKNGARPVGDQYEAESQLLNDEQLLVNADNAVMLSKLSLALALQLENPYDFDVVSYDPALDEKVLSISGQELYQQALKTQPQVNAARLRVESSRMGTRVARSAYYPSLTLFGNLNTNFSSLSQRVERLEPVISPATPVLLDGDLRFVQFFQQSPVFASNPYLNQLEQNLGIGVGIQLTVPIYNQGTVRANVNRAQVQERITSIQEDQVRWQLRNEVERARADALASRKSKEAAEKNLVAAERSFQDSEKRYSNGTISLFEFNTVQNRLRNAQTQAVRAKYDYIFRIKVLEFYTSNQLNF